MTDIQCVISHHFLFVEEKSDLSQDISTYLNLSEVDALSASAVSTSAAAAAEANQKRPLPTPRLKTLAEQLQSLSTIESDVGPGVLPHTSSRPPDLPVKVSDSLLDSKQIITSLPLPLPFQ